MIRDQSNTLVAIITVIGLILVPAMSLGSSSLKASPSTEDQTSSTTPSILPLVQSGNTQNHFMIDKSQFKKAPEFTGVTGFVNTRLL